MRLSIDYAPGQNWRPERLSRPFPLFKLSKKTHSEIENLWSEVSELENADRNLKTFHCIHTNDIEGVGTLEDSVGRDETLAYNHSMRLITVTSVIVDSQSFLSQY